MTLVVARRFGLGVVIMADTMVTDPGEVVRGLRPGQLKIVPIADRVTVAFAGCLNQSLDLIRAARRDLQAGMTLRDVISNLERATEDDECEFIVCAHTPDLLLIKLWKGRIASGLDQYTLGDAEPLNNLPDVSMYETEFKFAEHVRFRVSMVELFNEAGTSIAPTVGGFLVDRSCTPAAHEYLDHHAVVVWDTIDTRLGVTAEHAADRASGKTMFEQHCLLPAGVDAGVVGFYLPQPRVAFIYAPLVQDHAEVCRDVDSQTARAEVVKMANLPPVAPKS